MKKIKTTNLRIKIKADILTLFTLEAHKRNVYITFLYSGDLQRPLKLKDIILAYD